MWFIYCLSWIALFIQILFLTIGIAAGLYYLAEFVEEYTAMSKKIITWMTMCVLVIYILFIFLEDFTMNMIMCGLFSQIAHLFILNDYPVLTLSSPSFIIAVLCFFINHYLAFSFFSATFYCLSEVMAYFTICLWLVPFALFVSLSANENVLPTTTNTRTLNDDDDDNVLNSYLSNKGKKYGLLSAFQYLHNYILPQRNKKMF